jgi:hypothetical protein
MQGTFNCPPHAFHIKKFVFNIKAVPGMVERPPGI